MINKIRILGLIVLSIIAFAVLANNRPSPYVGQEGRTIKSLSDEDINALTHGKGWGLAKPAELNGVPGPAHILELKEELQLTPEQVTSIQALWETMNQSAKHYGERYLQSEAKIERFFNETETDEKQLPLLLADSANHLAKLRHVHLQAHLKAKPLLTTHQLMRYQHLRGYGSSDKHNQHSH